MDGQSRSREALGEFLEYLAEKGLMERNTVQARKAAVSRVLGVLDEDQANDVTAIDVDDVVVRFQRLHGRNYTPASLNAYKGRLRSALDDFKAYLNNPLGFRPNVQARTKAASRLGPEGLSDGTLRPERQVQRARSAAPSSVAPNILPIPIRPDLTIHIQGLPYDLTDAEARKIAAVVTAMVQQP